MSSAIQYASTLDVERIKSVMINILINRSTEDIFNLTPIVNDLIRTDSNRIKTFWFDVGERVVTDKRLGGWISCDYSVFS